MSQRRSWLVTGAAGFIGSHLVERLLDLEQDVVALDNFATGSRRNLEEVHRSVGEEKWSRLEFIEGDIRNLETCQRACANVEIVLHQAALGSVPRSVNNPLATHASNLTGFLNMLVAAQESPVRRFVYAGSSSTYGDSREMPRVEDRIGRPLSPYAITKYADELYARAFADLKDLESVGLRYFNVFGPRQDPHGAYAAVIPRWILNLLNGIPCQINGSGDISRDFTFVSNVVEANLLAATTEGRVSPGAIYNIGVGGRTTLNELFEAIRAALSDLGEDVVEAKPVYGAPRHQDIQHSQADISKARTELGYDPSLLLTEGLRETVAWLLSEDSRLEPAASGHTSDGKE